MKKPEKLTPTDGDKHGLTLFDLSDELLLNISRRLEKTNLVNFSKVNKKGKDISADKSIWQELLEYDFGIKLENCPQAFVSFKSYYTQCHQWQIEVLEKIKPQLDFLDKISKMHRSFTPIFDRPSKDGNKLAIDNIKVLINEINREDIKGEILAALNRQKISRDRNIFKTLFIREFAKLLDVCTSLYQQGNIFAGFERVKLYVDLYTDEEKRKWPVMELDSTVAYELALELIDKYKFPELQLQQYIDRILDATEAKIDEFKKTFMLRKDTVKQLVKDYAQKSISLDNILCLSPQELRLLQKVFLPMLIAECGDEIEKKEYKKLFEDVSAAVDKMVASITEENELSESSDSDAEDFPNDSDNDEATSDDQFHP